MKGSKSPFYDVFLDLLEMWLKQYRVIDLCQRKQAIKLLRSEKIALQVYIGILQITSATSRMAALVTIPASVYS